VKVRAKAGLYLL